MRVPWTAKSSNQSILKEINPQWIGLSRLDIAEGFFPGGSESEVSACSVGDLDSIPESGRSPGEGNGNPLQYSCLENPMGREAWWATVHGSQTVQHN